VKAGIFAVAVPSLTLMTMLAKVPAFAVAGVPESWPVTVLNAAHTGLFWIWKLSWSPSASLAAGLKE
jgi:hypothetical protein